MMIALRLRALCTGVLCLAAVSISACKESAYLVAIGRHNEVLSCWRDDQLLSPHDCIGKEVMAYRQAVIADDLDAIPGEFGSVIAETHEGYLAATTSDDKYMLDTWAIHLPPMMMNEWGALHSKGEVPLLPKHSTDPVPRFVKSDSKRLEPKAIKVNIGSKPNEAVARAELRRFIEESYSSTVFTFFHEDKYFRAPLIWWDVDTDGKSEAITIVTTYSQKAPTFCIADLLIVSFSDDGLIKDREKLVAEKRAGRCSLQDVGYGGWWLIETIAWPSAEHGVALAIESGMDSGDGYSLYVLDEIGAKTGPRVAADFLYVWAFD